MRGGNMENTAPLLIFTVYGIKPYDLITTTISFENEAISVTEFHRTGYARRLYAEVIHFYEGRIRRKISQYSAACRGYMVEWNNKQVDITDHYCLAEIKQSGQRRFISPRSLFFRPRRGRKSTRRDQRPLSSSSCTHQ